MRFAHLAMYIALLLAATSKAQETYTNPILKDAGADPAVLFHDGTYYLYTTNRETRVFTSTDLVHWTAGEPALPEPLRTKVTWAPEVYHHPEDGRFYMYYTLRYKLGVAVADSPAGPFEDLGLLIMGAIDAHPFRDDDGKLYLYFTNTPSFTMCVVEMTSPTTPAGSAVKCFDVSEPWEQLGHPINEGPWLLKRDGTYYMLYSGGDGQTVHYGIGYATAPTPLGPWTKHPRNPIMSSTATLFGPGHGGVAMDRAGQWWHLYHQKNAWRSACWMSCRA